MGDLGQAGKRGSCVVACWRAKRQNKEMQNTVPTDVAAWGACGGGGGAEGLGRGMCATVLSGRCGYCSRLPVFGARANFMVLIFDDNCNCRTAIGW